MSQEREIGKRDTFDVMIGLNDIMSFYKTLRLNSVKDPSQLEGYNIHNGQI